MARGGMTKKESEFRIRKCGSGVKKPGLGVERRGGWVGGFGLVPVGCWIGVGVWGRKGAERG